MSVNINTVTISSIEDRRLELGNAQAARVMDIGTNWNRLRIGCRLCLNDPGANITGSPRLYLGVMASPSAGMANGPLGSSTSHFLGLRTDVATLTRQVGPPIHFTGISSATNLFAKKVGSTVTTGTFNLTINISAAPSTNRPVWMVEITKGSPNFSLRASSNSAAACNDITLARFLNAMEIDSLSGAQDYLNQFGTYSAGGTTTTIAVNEAVDGYLNAIVVAWDRTSPVANVSDMMYTKLA